MSFLSPMAFAFLAALPVLLLLHLWRRKRRLEPVTNLFLWQGGPDEPEARFAWRRLREDWLLWIQILALLAIVFALARPALDWAPSGRDVVIVLDASASMNVVEEDGRTRFQKAQEQALALVEELGSRDRAQLILAKGRPAIVRELDASKKLVAELISRLAPTEGEASLADAVLLALGTKDASIYVFSDGATNAILPEALATDRVRYLRVGETADNVAITRFGVRRSPLSAFDQELFVEVFSFSPREHGVKLTVHPWIEEAFTLTPGERRAFAAGFAPPESAVLEARIEADDALEVDNVAYAIAGSAEPVSVLLATEGNPFLEKALTVHPWIESTVISPDAYRGEGDVVVLDGVAPPPSASGRFFVIAPGSEVRAMGGASPAVIQPRHPLVSFVELDGIQIERASVLDVPASGEILVESRGLPLLVAVDDGDARTVTLAFDVRSSNLPLSPSFPILVANVIDWLTPRHESSFQVGDVIAGAETNRVGVYNVGERNVVANLLSESESDIAPHEHRLQPTSSRSHRPSEGGPEVYAYGLFLALALLALEWVGYRRQSAANRAPVVLRGLVLTVLLLSLSGLKVRAGPSGTSVVFLLDRSGSISDDLGATALGFVERALMLMTSGDRAGVVAFGKEAWVESALSGERRLASIESTPTRTRTNIQAGLRQAMNLLPEGSAGRIVLLSDGNENAGKAAEEARLAAARGIPMDIFALGDSSRERAVSVRDVEAPKQVRVGEPFDIKVTVSGTDTIVRLMREGLVVSEKASGREGLVRFPQRLDTRGFHQFVVRAEGEENPGPSSADEGGAVVFASGRTRVLYPTGRPELTRILEGDGIEVVTMAPREVPSLPSELASFDAMILHDVPAGELNPRQMEAVASYVEELGGGLVMLGGERSFGPGGYTDTPIESVLPVNLGREQEQGSDVALVLVLDKSGSMSQEDDGLSRLDAAKEAALTFVDVLQDGDRLAIVAFDRVAHPIMPLRKRANESLLRNRLGALEPNGGTVMAPALQLAFGWLSAVEAERKHVLLLSDGQVEGHGQDEVERLESIARQMRDGDIVLSTVGLGEGVDREVLATLAASGGGRAYFTISSHDLGELFEREAMLISKDWLVERRFTPHVSDSHEILKGIDVSRIPPMEGLVRTTAKPLSRTVLASDEEEPVLAASGAGLGRSVVWTAELDERFAPLWTRMVRFATGGARRERLHANVAVEGDEAVLSVDAYESDGRFLNFLNPRAVVLGPDGVEQPIELRQVAAGRYEGRFDVPLKGAYTATVATEDEVLRLGHYVAALSEERTTGVNRALLENLARGTGGRVLSTEDNPFDVEATANVQMNLWRELAVAALFLFLLDVALRRGVRFPWSGRVRA